MTLRPVELKAQRNITSAFIDSDPRNVTLQRRSPISDGAGGRTWSEPVPLPPQRFRLIPQEDGATARTTAEGETATPEYMLMGNWDCNMERFDRFTLDGVRYEIVYVDNRQYEIKGEVIRYGN